LEPKLRAVLKEEMERSEFIVASSRQRATFAILRGTALLMLITRTLYRRFLA
jgi:hypothetical protein